MIIGLSSGLVWGKEVLELESVNIIAKPSKAGIEQPKGFNVIEIDASEFFNFNKNINQVLNSQPGIITRQKGALGSETELSINGLSGNQIRYFIDGISMESFGSALSLGDIPINVVKGINVYKGVVPISLSSDALGGAVDIQTPSVTGDFLSSSLTYGSFNTIKATLMAQESSTDERYFLRLSGFYNHADNDYIMNNVPDRDSLGNVNGTKSVRRFHDQYTSHMFNLKAGLASRAWADELSINLITAGNLKQEQHPGISINRVFGQYHRKNSTLLYSSTYKLDRDSYSLKAYVLGGTIKETYVDTASRRYRWNGDYIARDKQLGELASRSILNVKDTLFNSNIAARYRFTKATNFGLSFSHNNTERSGNDELNPNSGIYPQPNKMKKQVLAADYGQNWFDNLITSTLFIKKYLYGVKIVSIENIDINLKEVTTNIDIDKTGYGAAIELNLPKSFIAKLSYEKAYRMPEPDEIMGDGQFVLANPALQPEQSNNFNIGISHKKQYQQTYTALDAAFFYRNAKNFIHYVPTQIIRGKYLNVNQVDVRGIELSSLVDYANTYSLKASFTYQDLRNQSKFDLYGVRDVSFGSRVPNIPYLFANARLGWSYHTKQFNKLATYLSGNYVHQYFLDWENQGGKQGKKFIPAQLTYDLEFEYALYEMGLSATFAVNNITNVEAFDNFNIQKPGRAYYFKLTYSY